MMMMREARGEVEVSTKVDAELEVELGYVGEMGAEAWHQCCHSRGL